MLTKSGIRPCVFRCVGMEVESGEICSVLSLMVSSREPCLSLNACLGRLCCLFSHLLHGTCWSGRTVVGGRTAVSLMRNAALGFSSEIKDPSVWEVEALWVAKGSSISPSRALCQVASSPALCIPGMRSSALPTAHPLLLASQEGGLS